MLFDIQLMGLQYNPKDKRIVDCDWRLGIVHSGHKFLDKDLGTWSLCKPEWERIPSWTRIQVYNQVELPGSLVGKNRQG